MFKRYLNKKTVNILTVFFIIIAIGTRTFIKSFSFVLSWIIAVCLILFLIYYNKNNNSKDATDDEIE